MAQNGVGFTRRILAMYKQIKALSNQIKAGKYAVIAGSLFCFYGLYATSLLGRLFSDTDLTFVVG